MSENKNGVEMEMTCNNDETASNTDQVSPNGFLSYALSQEIVRALELLGYHEPTEIQREVIPAVLEGKNVVARSRTGTGKTAAFALPILQRLCAQPLGLGKRPIRALVLTPTRELAIQIRDELRDLCAFRDGVRVVCLYGGQAID